MTLASSERMKGLGAQSLIGALCGLSMDILSLRPNFLDFAYHFENLDTVLWQSMPLYKTLQQGSKMCMLTFNWICFEAGKFCMCGET